MAQIKIRGTRECLIINDRVAKDIQKVFLDVSISRNTPLVIGNWTGELKNIESILFDEEDSHNKKEMQQDTHMSIEIEERRKFLSKTLQEKSEELFFAELLYTIFTGEKKIPENLKEKFIDIQRNFFDKNPKRTICDVKEFETIVGKDATVGFATVYLEEIMKTDIRLSK